MCSSSSSDSAYTHYSFTYSGPILLLSLVELARRSVKYSSAAASGSDFDFNEQGLVHDEMTSYDGVVISVGALSLFRTSSRQEYLWPPSQKAHRPRRFGPH